MRLWRLAFGNLRRDLVGALLLAVAVAAGVGTLAFFAGLGRGVTAGIRQLFPEAERTLEVVPPRVRLGGLFGARLDDAAVARLRELPGVVEVERKMLLGVPASSLYQGNFFGAQLNIGIEVAAVGVDRPLLAADLPSGEPFLWTGQGPVPACVSDRLLALYDTTFAPSRGLPVLTASAVLGFALPVTVGRSMVAAASRGPVETVSARLACVSPRALLAGLTLPLEVVRGWNRRGGGDADSYSSVALTVGREDEVPRIEAEVRRLGFSTDETERQGAAAAGRAVAVFILTLELLSLLITALAALGIGQALMLSVRARRREIGLLRALGATPGDAAVLVLWEAGIVGFGGGVLGLAGAAVAARAADWLALRLLPAFPSRPSTFVLLSPGLAAAALGLAMLAALAGAFLPARLAARMDPVRSLAG